MEENTQSPADTAGLPEQATTTEHDSDTAVGATEPVVPPPLKERIGVIDGKLSKVAARWSAAQEAIAKNAQYDAEIAQLRTEREQAIAAARAEADASWKARLARDPLGILESEVGKSHEELIREAQSRGLPEEQERRALEDKLRKLEEINSQHAKQLAEQEKWRHQQAVQENVRQLIAEWTPEQYPESTALFDSQYELLQHADYWHRQAFLKTAKRDAAGNPIPGTGHDASHKELLDYIEKYAHTKNARVRSSGKPAQEPSVAQAAAAADGSVKPVAKSTPLGVIDARSSGTKPVSQMNETEHKRYLIEKYKIGDLISKTKSAQLKPSSKSVPKK